MLPQPALRLPKTGICHKEKEFLMPKFRFVLIAMTGAIILFSITAVLNDGFDLITPFLSPILALSWPAQFHVDFTLYLVLSGLWMAWRQGFSRGGVALGLLAAPLGMLFFAPYLIYLIAQTKGDPQKLLLGVHHQTGVSV